MKAVSSAISIVGTAILVGALIGLMNPPLWGVLSLGVIGAAIITTALERDLGE